MDKILTFLHSGDMGDIIASLCTVKEICARDNAKAYMLLDTSGGSTCNDDLTNKIILGQTKGKGLKFNDKTLSFLKPFLEIQPYIAKVDKWTPDLQIQIDYNLNDFRKSFIDKEATKKTNQNLVFIHQYAFGLDYGYKGPWLEVDSSGEKQHKIIVARSLRFQSSHGFYYIIEEQLKKNAEFIGTDFEQAAYKEAFGYELPHLKTNSLVDCAKYIKNSEMFLSNSTIFFWLAVGLGHPNIYHEMPIDITSSYFPNQNPASIHYVMGAHFVK